MQTNGHSTTQSNSEHNDVEEQTPLFSDLSQIVETLNDAIVVTSPRQSALHDKTSIDISHPSKLKVSILLTEEHRDHKAKYQHTLEHKDCKAAEPLLQAHFAAQGVSTQVVEPSSTPSFLSCTSKQSPSSSSAAPFKPATAIPDFAFSFDIDGVLEQSGKPLPGAAEALQLLNAENIPYIFLTNSGGKKESIRVKDLSERFGVPLSEDNFVQSHTPFKDFVSELAEKTILILGGVGNRCREIAEYYGYKNVITAADVIAAYPTYWPFNEVNPSYFHENARALPPLAVSGHTSSLKIDAIFVFSSPRDWGLECQLIVDLLLSHRGYLGTVSPLNGNTSLPNNGYQRDGQPTLYYSNGDFVWAARWHQPRFGQGAFREAVDGVWRQATGQPGVLKHVLGKPSDITYSYAELMLVRHCETLFKEREKVPTMRTVYMIGDNTESDIRGANEFVSKRGMDWLSILVETGVHIKGETPAYTPTAILPTVFAAVRWALEREQWSFKS